MPDPVLREESINLDRAGEREVLALLKEVLGEHPTARWKWLERKLSERAAVGRRVVYLLSLVEARNE